jgi:hypothetical protein
VSEPTRDSSELYAALVAEATRRVPGFRPVPGLAADGLLQIAARMLSVVDEAAVSFDEAAAFTMLNLVGERRLPAQAASVPLVFTAADEGPPAVLVPAGTQVRARPVPERPTPAVPIDFVTDKDIAAVAAKIAGLYSVEPGTDRTADHTAHLSSGFSLFDDLGPVEHALYLGHDELFRFPNSDPGGINGPAHLLQITFAFRRLRDAPVREDLQVVWEYLSTAGWLPLAERLDGRQTVSGFFTTAGATLHKDFGPASKRKLLFDHETYWVRARLLTPLPSRENGGPDRLPVIERIQGSIRASGTDLRIEKAFAESATIDLSRPFRPFGAWPQPQQIFLLTCDEAFSRKGADIALEISCANTTASAATDPELEWEYSAAAGWKSLGIKSALSSVNFEAPRDWEPVEVGGEKARWLRVRIAKGDYGAPSSVVGTPAPPATPISFESKRNERIPVIDSISVSYRVSSTPLVPTAVAISNDFATDDVTQSLLPTGDGFASFRSAVDRDAAVYLAFDRALPTALVSLYVSIADEDLSLAPQTSPFVWEYQGGEGWLELSVDDQTFGFRRSGTIQFIGPWDAVPTTGLGGTLYRFRARVKLGAVVEPLPVSGVWLNAVMAHERRRFELLPLGEGTGLPRQVFRLVAPQSTDFTEAANASSATTGLRFLPVLEGERVEVREWVGRRQGGLRLFDDLRQQDVRVERNSRTGEMQIWVLWHEVDALARCGPEERCYTLDRSAGVFRFGDSQTGLAPPVGAPVVLSYRAGGRSDSNLPANHVADLQSPLPLIERVTNPLPASGGAPAEAPAAAQRRGLLRPGHRGRAVTVAEYEALALEASPAVARARCLPCTGSGGGGGGQRGWVTIVVVPHGIERTPIPDAELRRRIHAYLAERVPSTVAYRIRVIPPLYRPISVAADVVPLPGVDPGLLEPLVRQRLDAFLHPLTGAPDGAGWAVGASLYLSHVANLVEETPGVDHARTLRLLLDGGLQGDRVDLPADALVAAARHEIKLTLSGRRS